MKEKNKDLNVSIIILNWNNWNDTIECLESIYNINYSYYNVILIDNNSSDDSTQKIRNFSKKIIKEGYGYIEYDFENGNILNNEIRKLTLNKNFVLIKSDSNYGFAEGNNIGIRYVLNNLNSSYILLLNNDTIVDKKFLTELVKVAESYKNIGSVQSLLLRPDGKVIDSLGQKISLWSAQDEGMNTELIYDIKDSEIFGACAAAALYRSEIFEKVGLFDEDFFIILEDVDISWRIRLNNLKSILASKSIVYHKRGISDPMSIYKIIFGKKTEYDIFKWYHGSKNWLIIVIRYYSLFIIINGLIRYPHKFFFTFFRCLYSSIKLRKTYEVLRIFQKNILIRKQVKKNSLLNEIQKKWIKK